MKKSAPYFSLILLSITGPWCTSTLASTIPQKPFHDYRSHAMAALAPYFKRAHVAYPPKKMTLLAFKQERRLELWAPSSSGTWQHIKDFVIYGASGGPGPKLLNHDRQVPEGVYMINGFNPRSRFHLSMRLNYPNQFDIVHATSDARRNLGNDIFIHGSNQSIGCLAMGDKNIEQLFMLAYAVSPENIKVIIAPHDLRVASARTHSMPHTPSHPIWLPELYAQISAALQPYRLINTNHRA